jgi:hypothetical protein
MRIIFLTLFLALLVGVGDIVVRTLEARFFCPVTLTRSLDSQYHAILAAADGQTPNADGTDLINVLGALETRAARQTLVRLAAIDLGEAANQSLAVAVEQNGTAMVDALQAGIASGVECPDSVGGEYASLSCRKPGTTRALLEDWLALVGPDSAQ